MKTTMHSQAVELDGPLRTSIEQQVLRGDRVFARFQHPAVVVTEDRYEDGGGQFVLLPWAPAAVTACVRW